MTDGEFWQTQVDLVRNGLRHPLDEVPDIEVLTALILAGMDHSVEPRVTRDMVVNVLAGVLVDRPAVLDEAIRVAAEGTVNLVNIAPDSGQVSLPRAALTLGRVKRLLD